MIEWPDRVLADVDGPSSRRRDRRVERDADSRRGVPTNRVFVEERDAAVHPRKAEVQHAAGNPGGAIPTRLLAALDVNRRDRRRSSGHVEHPRSRTAATVSSAPVPGGPGRPTTGLSRQPTLSVGDLLERREPLRQNTTPVHQPLAVGGRGVGPLQLRDDRRGRRYDEKRGGKQAFRLAPRKLAR